MNDIVWIAVFMMLAVAVHAADVPGAVLSGKVNLIDGKAMSLGTYTGKVVLVVNVASRCGYTKQYKQLQELHVKYGERGLAVLGFPCNQFGKQEPGSDTEIKTFCDRKFSVSFPMFSKIDVNGENASPLYQYLTSDKIPVNDQGPVKWNFEKFLLNREGVVIARYRSGVSPDAVELLGAIEAALGDNDKD
jgi:glutathione peroxidase